MELGRKGPWIENRADIRRHREVGQANSTGFNVELHFGEANRVGHIATTCFEVILRHPHQPETSQSSTSRLGHVINVFGQFMAVILATDCNGPLSSTRKRHPL